MPILMYKYNIYEYVFGYMNFEQIWCRVKVSNKHTININIKMGYEIEDKFVFLI